MISTDIGWGEISADCTYSQNSSAGYGGLISFPSASFNGRSEVLLHSAADMLEASDDVILARALVQLASLALAVDKNDRKWQLCLWSGFQVNKLFQKKQDNDLNTAKNDYLLNFNIDMLGSCSTVYMMLILAYITISPPLIWIYITFDAYTTFSLWIVYWV